MPVNDFVEKRLDYLEVATITTSLKLVGKENDLKRLKKKLLKT